MSFASFVKFLKKKKEYSHLSWKYLTITLKSEKNPIETTKIFGIFEERSEYGMQTDSVSNATFENSIFLNAISEII